MKLATAVAKRKVDRPADAQIHARALHALAAPMKDVFPNSSGHPKIDGDREGFEAAVEAYEKATWRLVKSAWAESCWLAEADCSALAEFCCTICSMLDTALFI